MTPSTVVGGVFVTDPSISSSSAGGTEPSIAVNPSNPKQIAITRFTFLWNSNADMLYSTDDGITWTNETTIPVPPGVAGTSGCPCDQTLDYGNDGTLYGTFLTTSHVVTGSTSDPTSAAAWKWNGNPAQVTDKSGTSPDQPWLLVNRDPTTSSQDNAYVAYDDFAGSPDARVAVSYGATPVNITADNKAGTESPLATNPGLRLGKDPSNGWMYALYEQSSGSGQPKSVTYKLNRSTDGGATWTLNGSSDGLTVDTVNSDQAPGFKFGGVNALLGGVDHVAVDPTTHDVYVVYGQDVSGGNQIKIRQLTDNGSGGLNVGAAHNVSSSTDTALPSVAVLTDGTVGVLYISHDGTAGDGLPKFSAHFARSTDGGSTWNDVTLQSFESPVGSNSDDRQRVFGDYDQLKSVGNVFYGVYSGNGNGFGASTSVIDPIFFTVPQATTTTYTGPTSADYHDTFTASAKLTDSSGAALSGEPIVFKLGAGTGSETCTASTDGTGTAKCSLTPTEAAGSYTITASFAGDADHLASSDSEPFTITKEETTAAYTGPTVILAGSSTATLTGKLVEDGSNDNDGDPGSPGPFPSESVTLSLGSQSCTAMTDSSGNVTCTISPVSVPLGPETASAVFAGDGFYLPSSDSKTVTVFAFPSTGAFTLGDLTVAGAGSSTVTWWSSNWWQLNSLSGGAAPASFKGFASTVTLPTSSPATVCSGNWTTSGGNSPPPVATVPSYMGVIVPTKITKSGSTINGNYVKIVVVKTNPGYAPDPSHPGTGTIVATFCG